MKTSYPTSLKLSKEPTAADELNNYLGTPIYNPPVNLLEKTNSPIKTNKTINIPSETVSENKPKQVKRKKLRTTEPMIPYPAPYPVISQKPKITGYILLIVLLFVGFCFLTHPKTSNLLDKYLASLTTTRGVITRGVILAVIGVLSQTLIAKK